jgi:hypothetical protein
MKKLSLFIALLIVAPLTILAQVPQGMKYQTVVRNAQGEPLANQNVSLRLGILENGNEIYEETHSATTTDYGLVNVNLGEGQTSDDFSDISWGSANYEVEVEIDQNGGTNYVLMGTSSLLSVPFALRAETANDVDDADADPANEIQTLSLNNNELSISNGNSVTLPEAAEVEEKSKAWVHVPITGNPNLTFDGFNVTNVSHTTTGVYVVSFPPGLFSVATNPAMVCTVANDLAAGVAIPTYGGAPSQVTVRTYDMNGNLSDREFNLVVFGK